MHTKNEYNKCMMMIGARLAGGVRTVPNVLHTQAVFTEHVTVRGNVIVSPAGVVCFAIKVDS